MREFTIKNFSNNVAILQLESLQDSERVEVYARSLTKGSIILLGEYVLDPFFLAHFESLMYKTKATRAGAKDSMWTGDFKINRGSQGTKDSKETKNLENLKNHKNVESKNTTSNLQDFNADSKDLHSKSHTTPIGLLPRVPYVRSESDTTGLSSALPSKLDHRAMSNSALDSIFLESSSSIKNVLAQPTISESLSPQHSKSKSLESHLKNKHKLDLLLSLSKQYHHTIIAPCVEYKGRAYYKNMLILSEGKVHRYTQQRLIQYEHWNEARFFANDVSRLPKAPLMFCAGGMRFGVLFGFEAHFDEFWMEFKKAEVDVVLVPSASAFSSNQRWQSLLSTHAFTNSCYVFRANRIGEVIASDGERWEFYGHSFVALGQEIVDSLDSKEGMLCVEVDIDSINRLKSSWGFR